MRLLWRRSGKRSRTTTIVFIALLAQEAWTLGCGAGGASPAPPPLPPQSTAVSVTPTSESVLLGNQATFTATVTNTSDTTVSWSVNGVAGGNATVGTITFGGLYTGPAELASRGTVQVTATSLADSAKFSTATLAITSDIALNLSPSPASLELGATQTFRATVTSSGHPDASIRWSLSGPACATGCGPVDASGNYTAPRTLPPPPTPTPPPQPVPHPSHPLS